MKVLPFPASHFDRRRPENRLQRVVAESEELEARQIDYWLSLAEVALQAPAKSSNEDEEVA